MENKNTEQNNQELIQKLMEQNTIQEKKEEEQITISTARVSSIKYRLYVLIFLALIIV
jgi:hypothetical protein